MVHPVHVLELANMIVRKVGLLQRENFNWQLYRIIGIKFVTDEHYRALIVYHDGRIREYCDHKIYTAFGWGRALQYEKRKLMSDMSDLAKCLMKLLGNVKVVIIEHHADLFGHLTWLYQDRIELEIVPLVEPTPAWYTCRDVEMFANKPN